MRLRMNVWKALIVLLPAAAAMSVLTSPTYLGAQANESGLQALLAETGSPPTVAYPAQLLTNDLQAPLAARDEIAQAGNALARNQSARALPLIEHALTLDPKFGRAWYFLGVVAVRNGQWAQAEQAFQTAIANSPTLVEASEALGHLELQAGRLDSARKDYERALRQPGAGWRAPYDMAVLDIAEHKYAEASNMALKAAAEPHASPESLYLAAAANDLNGQIRPVMVLYLKYLQSHPRQAPAVAAARRRLAALAAIPRKK